MLFCCRGFDALAKLYCSSPIFLNFIVNFTRTRHSFLRKHLLTALTIGECIRRDLLVLLSGREQIHSRGLFAQCYFFYVAMYCVFHVRNRDDSCSIIYG